MKYIKEFIQLVRGEIPIRKLIKNGLCVGKNFWYGKGCSFDYSHCWLITIGDNVVFSSNVHILAHDASTKKLCGYTRIGRVTINNNVFIGFGSIILPNVCIGEGAVIGAGSVVTRDIPPYEVWGGVPAKFITTLGKYEDKTKKSMQNCLLYGKEYTISYNIGEQKKREMLSNIKQGEIAFIK